MKKLLVATILFCCGMQINAQELRSKLENVYKAFSEAMKNKDGEKLKTTLSSYAYMNIKNEMLSSGEKFPADFFVGAAEMQNDLSKLTFIKVLTNGPTANCIYYGKDKYGETNLYILKFLQENNEWRFNLMEESGSDNLAKNIKANDFSFLTQKSYQPDGIVPQTPKEIVPGDYKAMLDISASGFVIEVSVNGVFQEKLSEGSYSGLVMGGIKKGTNTIEIKILGKNKESLFPISVKIRALVNEEEKEVFLFKEKIPANIITKEFVVQ